MVTFIVICLPTKSVPDNGWSEISRSEITRAGAMSRITGRNKIIRIPDVLDRPSELANTSFITAREQHKFRQV